MKEAQMCKEWRNPTTWAGSDASASFRGVRYWISWQ